MAIPTGNIVIPALTFPSLWARNININSAVNGDGSASCMLIPYSVDGSGNVTQGKPIQTTISNIVSRASALTNGAPTDPLLAAALQLVEIAVSREFLAQGLIPAPAANPATDAGVLGACAALLTAIAAVASGQ